MCESERRRVRSRERGRHCPKTAQAVEAQPQDTQDPERCGGQGPEASRRQRTPSRTCCATPTSATQTRWQRDFVETAARPSRRTWRPSSPSQGEGRSDLEATPGRALSRGRPTPRPRRTPPTADEFELTSSIRHESPKRSSRHNLTRPGSITR